MSERARGKSPLLRHLYTCAETGRLGSRGFQTVACSRRLEAIVEKLEGLVEGYRPPEREGPGCRQLMPVPGFPQFYAFTAFTPTGACPDGREGNFWAETLVVDAGWLEGSGWDAEAAFRALPWREPEDPAGLDWELPVEEPPPLAPCAVERLSRLRDGVAEPLLLPLVLALVQQSRGLQPVRVVEDPEAGPGQLAEVILHLPLVVPPACRTYPDGGHRRCLSLRTVSPQAGMPTTADLTGWPAAAADQAEAAGSLVLDLAGRLDPPRSRERFGKTYATWLAQAIRGSRWDAIADLYQRAQVLPGAAFFAHFRELLPEAEQPARRAAAPAEAAPRPEAAAADADRIRPATAPAAATEPAGEEAPAAAPPAGPSPWQQRRQAWEERDRAEGEIAKVLERHRRQLEELVTTAGKQLAAESKQAEKTLWHSLDGHKGDLARTLEEAEDDLARGSREISTATAALAKERQNLERQQRDLEDKVQRLEKRLSGLQKEVKRLRKKGGVPGPAAAAEEGLLEEELEEETVGQRLADWLRRPAVAWSAAGLALLLLLGYGLSHLWPRAGGAGSPIGAAGGGAAFSAAARREALVRRLQDGAAAARLLQQAAAREELTDRAGALTLALHLQRAEPLPDGERCVLAQAALHRRAQAAGEAPVAVDGQCGAGTRRALAAAAAGSCCADFGPAGPTADPIRLQGCFVGRVLGLAEEDACAGASPWRRGRSWSEEEASRALALVRHAFDVVAGDREEALAPALAGLDPATSPELRRDLAGAALSPEDARRLLDLAYALSVVDAGARAPETFRPAQLDRLETMLGPDPAPATEETAAGSGGDPTAGAGQGGG